MGGGTGRVVVVRHGETEWSQAGRHTGRTDVGLSEEGRSQARRVGASLAGLTFDEVLTSPLARAVETCALAGLGAQARQVPDLAEWDYGDYEGLTSAEIHRVRPGWRLWTDGAPGGEQPADVALRADRVIAVIGGAGEAAVFAHGHFLRVLAARWVGWGPQSGAGLRLDAASISVLGHEHEDRVISLWNAAAGSGLLAPQ